MNKKSVAFFVENLAGGGVEKILQIILKHWDYKRYPITLYSIREEKELFNQLFPNTIDYHYIFERDDINDKKITQLLKKLKNKILLLTYYHCPPSFFYHCFIRKSFDVGVAFIEGFATRILSGAPSGMRKIAWLHTDFQKNHWTDIAFRNREEEKKCYRNIEHIVCVSKEVKRQIDDLYETQDHSLIVYNPIDKNEIIYQSEFPIEEKRKSDNCTLIVSFGRLERGKGFERLINIAFQLQQSDYYFELWIIGDGSEKSKLEQQINGLQLGQTVRLLGYKNNPYPYLKACDFYVCPSYAEGYNTAITEALILGKPIVSTDCSGVREQLGDSEYGIVTENKVIALYEGICKMMNSNNLQHYEEMANRRKSLFNLECQMEKIYELIDE